MDGSSIDYMEGRVYSLDDENAIRPDFLQTIDYSGRRQRISYQMNEFAAVCPFSGLPDTGIVWVDYISQKNFLN